MRKTWICIALAAAALAVGATSAAASSIAYVKDGNVWLSSPDGAKSYQLTFAGGYSSPSQADDGTLVVQKGGTFFHITRSGQVFGSVAGMGGDAALSAGVTDGKTRFYGPFDPKVSP